MTQVDATKTAQTTIYTTIKAKIDTLITSAKANGYDTTKLAAAATAVQTSIDTYGVKASAYTTDLTTAKGLSCGDSDGAFASAIVTARADLLVIRTAAKDVRTTIQSTAIPAINDYATWLKTNSATTTTQGGK
jgi:hypothetical protein